MVRIQSKCTVIRQGNNLWDHSCVCRFRLGPCSCVIFLNLTRKDWIRTSKPNLDVWSKSHFWNVLQVLRLFAGHLRTKYHKFKKSGPWKVQECVFCRFEWTWILNHQDCSNYFLHIAHSKVREWNYLSRPAPCPQGDNFPWIRVIMYSLCVWYFVFSKL